MNLSEKPDFVSWPESHYIFIEKVGPFQNTAPAAWKELHGFMQQLHRTEKILKTCALYKMEPQMVYRAGMVLAEKPKELPPGFSYEFFKGGKYARFTLVGSYMQLPEACGRVFDQVKKQSLPVRNDFYVEHYVNNPSDTPEEKLITEILIPTT